MPKVSVIIATYNREKFVCESLESVLNQTYRDYEVIVINDGSTDNTEELLGRYANRIKYKRIDHAGISVSRNTGLRMASGDLIAFNDDDDVWLPGCLELRAKCMEDHPDLDMLFADVVLFNEQGTLFDSWMAERSVFRKIPKTQVNEHLLILGGNIFDFLVQERFITMPTLMVRRRCLDKVGHFDESLIAQDDYDLYLRLARDGTVGYLDKQLAKCRMHGKNISGNPERRLKSRIALWEKFTDYYPDLPRTSLRLIIRELSRTHHELGYYYFERGELANCRRQFKAGLKHRWPLNKSLVYYFASFSPALIKAGRALKRRLSKQSQ